MRFLLWTLFFYFLWKIVKALIAPSQRRAKSAPKPQSRTPFQDVQEAEFEDITPKQSPDGTTSPSK
jgi:hypothetical protein